MKFTHFLVPMTAFPLVTNNVYFSFGFSSSLEGGRSEERSESSRNFRFLILTFIEHSYVPRAKARKALSSKSRQSRSSASESPRPSSKKEDPSTTSSWDEAIGMDDMSFHLLAFLPISDVDPQTWISGTGTFILTGLKVKTSANKSARVWLSSAA